MIFRPYIPDDFQRLYAIEMACFLPLFRFSRPTMRQLLRKSQAAAWVAEETGRLAGFAIVEWTEGESGITAYLATIEVASIERGHGVGSLLLRRAEDSARTAGANAIWLHVDRQNPGAIHLYEARGYRFEGVEENYYPQGRTALLYAKRLHPGTAHSCC